MRGRGRLRHIHTFVCIRYWRFAGEEMGVAGFFGAGLAGKNRRERRVAVGQAVESRDYVIEGFEVVHAVGAAAEFAGSLRSAEQERADDGDFAAVEIEDFLQAV